MSSRTLTLVTLLVVAAEGCALDASSADSSSTFALTLPATDAARVLDLVNYPGADAHVLDDLAGLDSRAVTNIRQHRAGADGVFPNADDDLFDDIAELDAIPYVGDVAFLKLQTYAQAHPAPSRETVEGVLFRGWESEIVAFTVNNADLAALDEVLDARAAQNLIAARPFASVAEMGPVSYVGASALTSLRGKASAWWTARDGGTSGGALAGTFDGVTFDEATAVIALDIANKASRELMVEHGVYAAGAAAIFGNRPYATLGAVASVGGVGGATVQGLHDYAASGTWTPGVIDPPEPPDMPHTPPSNECAFGLVYRDVFRGEAIVVTAKRTMDPASDTNATQRAQIVSAVSSTYTDVTTVSQAFDAVDESLINHSEIWDASNRRAYTAYEFGAGDNSYGRIFEYGTTNVVTNVIDGDLYDCSVTWGNEMRPCERTVDCADGLTCTGTSEEVSTGRCINLSAPRDPRDGTQCTSEGACGLATGLVCAGLSSWGAGTCNPAWMRGHFETSFEGASIPDASSTGLTLSLPVYGLTTVPTDVRIDLWIDHPRVSDLSVTLINPIGTENVVVAAGTMSGPELVLRDFVQQSFAGDEPVNGIWQIRVVDHTGGSTGQVMRFGMTVTSRWD